MTVCLCLCVSMTVCLHYVSRGAAFSNLKKKQKLILITEVRVKTMWNSIKGFITPSKMLIIQAELVFSLD